LEEKEGKRERGNKGNEGTLSVEEIKA